MYFRSLYLLLPKTSPSRQTEIKLYEWVSEWVSEHSCQIRPNEGIQYFLVGVVISSLYVSMQFISSLYSNSQSSHLGQTKKGLSKRFTGSLLWVILVKNTFKVKGSRLWKEIIWATQIQNYTRSCKKHDSFCNDNVFQMRLISCETSL